MEVQQFEQAILKMAFETDAKITTASVAYYLGISSRKANELLETLLAQGVLELDSDDEGNLYYFVPNQGRSGGSSLWDDDGDDGWQALEAAADAAAGSSDDQDADADIEAEADDGPVANDQAPSFANHLTTTVDDDTAPPLSPQQFSPHQGADGQSMQNGGNQSGPYQSSDFDSSPAPRQTANNARPYADAGGDHSWHQRRQKPSNPYGAYGDAAPSSGPTQRTGRSRFSGIPTGTTSRLGRPDARPNRCGDDSLIVDAKASCESRPLADARPTMTACADPTPNNFSTHQEYGGFGFTSPTSSTALATTAQTGEMALTADGHHIDQPEHQPGMALLLSLILCGTGQIYNGEVSKGIIMLILCFLLWFVFLGWVVHIWSIVDAVVVAERINRKSSSNG